MKIKTGVKQKHPTKNTGTRYLMGKVELSYAMKPLLTPLTTHMVLHISRIHLNGTDDDVFRNTYNQLNRNL